MLFCRFVCHCRSSEGMRERVMARGTRTCKTTRTRRTTPMNWKNEFDTRTSNSLLGIKPTVSTYEMCSVTLECYSTFPTIVLYVNIFFKLIFNLYKLVPLLNFFIREAASTFFSSCRILSLEYDFFWKMLLFSAIFIIRKENHALKTCVFLIRAKCMRLK